MPRSNSIFNTGPFSHLLNAHNFSNLSARQSPYLPHLPPASRPSFGPMSSYQPIGQPPPPLMSGQCIPTSLPQVPQSSPMIRPSPPPPPVNNNSGPINAGLPKMPISLPMNGPPVPNQMDFNPNLPSSSAQQLQQQALTNPTAAAIAAALLPYGPLYFNPNTSSASQLSSQQALEYQLALNAAAAAASNHLAVSSNGSVNSNNNAMNNSMNHSSRNNNLPPMKRPISATNMLNDTLSPNKKIPTQPPSQNPTPNPLPANLSNPYLPYPMPRSNSIFNTGPFSHLLNAHNFSNLSARQSPYLPHLQAPSRPSFGPMSSFQPIGQPPPSLMSGQCIPTSLSQVPQSSPMIRPSPPPPPVSNNSGPLNPAAAAAAAAAMHGLNPNPNHPNNGAGNYYNYYGYYGNKFI